MFQITKNEPHYFKQAKRKVTNQKISQAWEDSNIDVIRYNLRSDILLNEQNLLCAYCEKEIDAERENSNIDHYKTRKLFPDKTLNYDNLFVSCNSKVSCSHIKDNYGLQQSDYQKIVNPVIENPDDYFEYGFAGDILVKDNLSPSDKTKAEFTIKVFALDNKSLTDARKSLALMVKAYAEQNFPISEVFNYLNDYKSFTKYIYNKLQGATV